MRLEQMFESNGEAFVTGMRKCGMCGETKSVDNFYRDGKDGRGNIRWRRDCKDCYKVTRMHEAKQKTAKEKRQKGS